MYTRLGSFHDYYVKEWKGKLEMWAHAYPPGAPHANGHIDSYHVVIKTLFFVTKFNVLPFPHPSSSASARRSPARSTRRLAC